MALSWHPGDTAWPFDWGKLPEYADDQGNDRRDRRATDHPADPPVELADVLAVILVAGAKP